jgi:hypothetical protein
LQAEDHEVATPELAFGPATVTLFGTVVPVFPALAGCLSVYLARLIAPNKTDVSTVGQKIALVGMLMLLELVVVIQWTKRFHTAEAVMLGLTLGWFGILVPEKFIGVLWDWFKGQLRGWLQVPEAPPVSKYTPDQLIERKQHMQKIFTRIWPTEKVPDDEKELIERLKNLD